MTEQEQKVERHLIETSVDDAAGTQVWWVDAISKEDALLKFESGEGEIYSNEVEVVKLGEPLHIGTTNLDDFGDGDKPLSEATTTITVPKQTWDAMRDALMAAEFHLVEMGQRGNGLHKQCEDALTAANAVIHPQATEPQAQGKDHLNVASQCRATASHPISQQIEVDGGNGTLFMLLMDAAHSIEQLMATHPQATEPAGWKWVPVTLTPEMMRDMQLYSEIGGYITANWAGAYDCLQELYSAALAAAPEAP